MPRSFIRLAPVVQTATARIVASWRRAARTTLTAAASTRINEAQRRTVVII